MKILLNLLPEEEKNLVQTRLRSRFLLWQLFLLFLLEMFYFTILIGMYLILDFQFRSLESLGTNQNVPVSVQGEKLNQYEKKFRDTNEQVLTIGKIERSHFHFTQIFLLLDTLLPPGVTVSALNTKEYVVSLSGKATTREDLLLLDERLKGSECITDVNIPLSNLFSQQDIDFQIDFQIQPECLRKYGL